MKLSSNSDTATVVKPGVGGRRSSEIPSPPGAMGSRPWWQISVSHPAWQPQEMAPLSLRELSLRVGMGVCGEKGLLRVPNTGEACESHVYGLQSPENRGRCRMPGCFPCPNKQDSLWEQGTTSTVIFFSVAQGDCWLYCKMTANTLGRKMICITDLRDSVCADCHCMKQLQPLLMEPHGNGPAGALKAPASCPKA